MVAESLNLQVWHDQTSVKQTYFKSLYQAKFQKTEDLFPNRAVWSWLKPLRTKRTRASEPFINIKHDGNCPTDE